MIWDPASVFMWEFSAGSLLSSYNWAAELAANRYPGTLAAAFTKTGVQYVNNLSAVLNQGQLPRGERLFNHHLQLRMCMEAGPTKSYCCRMLVIQLNEKSNLHPAAGAIRLNEFFDSANITSYMRLKRNIAEGTHQYTFKVLVDKTFHIGRIDQAAADQTLNIQYKLGEQILASGTDAAVVATDIHIEPGRIVWGMFAEDNGENSDDFHVNCPAFYGDWKIVNSDPD